MGWTCPQNGNITKCQKVSQMKPIREKKKGKNDDDMEKKCLG